MIFWYHIQKCPRSFTLFRCMLKLYSDLRDQSLFITIVGRVMYFSHETLTCQSFQLKATMGVHNACLHQVYKSCVIWAIPSQTYDNVWWWSPKTNTLTPSLNLRRPPSCISIGLWCICSKWHTIHKPGEYQLQKPHIVALNHHWSWKDKLIQILKPTL